MDRNDCFIRGYVSDFEKKNFNGKEIYESWIRHEDIDGRCFDIPITCMGKLPDGLRKNDYIEVRGVFKTIRTVDCNGKSHHINRLVVMPFNMKSANKNDWSVNGMCLEGNVAKVYRISSKPDCVYANLDCTVSEGVTYRICIRAEGQNATELENIPIGMKIRVSGRIESIYYTNKANKKCICHEVFIRDFRPY